MKRLMILLLALLMCAVPALAENVRTAEVYDRTADEGALSIRFVDMGAPESGSPGDCVILISPDDQVMVIDSGLSENREDVAAALDKLGVTRIDALVISHPHGDHTQNMPYLMLNYEVSAVYTSYIETPDANNYIKYMAAIEAQNLPHIRLAQGDSFSFGEQVTVDILSPESEIEYPEGFDDTADFVNNHSLVMKFTYGESTYLTSGDLYLAAESALVKTCKEALDVDVIKLNHHGYSTSSGITWCNATSPEIAVAPADTLYNFSTYKRLSRKGDVYVTGLDGTVCVRMYPDDSKTVVTERDYDYASIGLK